MKLWQKDITLDQQIEQFTIGKDQELDLQLASFDVLGSLAHIQMLEKIDLLTKAELSLLQGELQSIYLDIQAGEFQIEAGIEDIHSQIEYLLTARLGEVGKKIHAGRSRNDQVLVDLRLFFRSEIKTIAELLRQVIQLLLKKSEASKNVLMPGYTHTQIGMLSS
ncbi:MAG: argininosuccinate lyase, partial [Saprospiraceae bacterium]|nr:argininosuccinate lyase [Saprospiraceae bacterium]